MQDLSVFSILWFCILITSFLLFIFLTGCGECNCCNRKKVDREMDRVGGYKC